MQLLSIEGAQDTLIPKSKESMVQNGTEIWPLTLLLVNLVKVNS